MTTDAMRTLSRSIFIIVLVLCLAQAVYYYPLLPERVASHFGPSGRPDAWSGKDAFIEIYVGVIAFIAVLFSGMGFVLRKIPDSMINLPNKDYWLSPGRRQETVDRIARQAFWFGSATLVLMLDVFRQVFRVHLGEARTLEHPVASIVAYVGFGVIWSIVMIRGFMRKPA